MREADSLDTHVRYLTDGGMEFDEVGATMLRGRLVDLGYRPISNANDRTDDKPTSETNIYARINKAGTIDVLVEKNLELFGPGISYLTCNDLAELEEFKRDYHKRLEKRNNVENNSESFLQSAVESLGSLGAPGVAGILVASLAMGKFSTQYVALMFLMALSCGVGGGVGAYFRKRKMEKEEKKAEVSFLEKYAARLLFNEGAYQYALLPAEGTN